MPYCQSARAQLRHTCSCGCCLSWTRPRRRSSRRARVARGPHRSCAYTRPHLLGFIVFYGLENLVAWSRERVEPDDRGRDWTNPVYLLHVGGFALYAWLVTYLVMELPTEKDGRFWPFVTGAVAYTALLLLMR